MEMRNWITDHKDVILDDLLSVLAIESVEGEPLPGMPNGKNVNEALERMLKIGEGYGFRTGNIDGHAGYIEYGEGDD
jgi:succinyl-diaminopimelate desuccinylase